MIRHPPMYRDPFPKPRQTAEGHAEPTVERLDEFGRWIPSPLAAAHPGADPMPPIRRVSMAEALAAAGVPETAPQAHAVIANPAVRAVAHALDQIANRCHARDVLSAVERLANEQDLSHAATKVAELKLAHEAAANMLELMTAQIPATHRSAPAQAPKRAAEGKEK